MRMGPVKFGGTHLLGQSLPKDRPLEPFTSVCVCVGGGGGVDIPA